MNNAFSGLFLGPRGPLVLPLFGPPPRLSVRPQEFLLFLLLLLLFFLLLLFLFSSSSFPFYSSFSSSPFSLLLLFLVLQIIIQRIRPLANDHPEDKASCKWSSAGTGLLQMIIHHPSHLCQDPDSISRTFLEQLVLVLITDSREKWWCP